ncbi:MAG TPA: phenylalanine--tRNA ligase subunit beta [bacterium]|nr:phenylalanine--tRNA ligase subunit beta [bacterium]
MRIPLAWLGDLVELPDVDDLVRRLNEAGLECHVGSGPELPQGIVTGRIVECERHPNADRLSVCTVDVGDGEPRTIVCGAPNAAAGPVGAVALPGTEIGDFTIAERKLRGVKSQGMLCSERELGLSESHDGILLFPEDTPVGRPLRELLGSGGVMEAYPSSNRGDLMSMTGLAREVAAVLGRRWEPDAPVVPAVDGDAGWSARIENAEDCPRYCGRILRGVTPGPSPDWMAERLTAAGIRPLMNLIDVTNYVLLERGHPLHAFDLAKLRGTTIGVRRAKAGEELVTLDGKRRELPAGTLVITDDSGAVATGGIMGGESTMVSDATTEIFLEAASFHPSRVRHGSRGLRLQTDASARFERGVDPAGIPDALDRAVELLLELCPGASLTGCVDAYPAPVSPVRITLRSRTLRRVLGAELTSAEVRGALESLGLTVRDESAERWEVEAPTFRRDLTAEEDLVEEVGRIHGYDRFPERTSVRASAAGTSDARADAFWRARGTLLGLGLTEVVTPSLVDGARETALTTEGAFFRKPVALRNPMASDRNCLRGSLIPSLLQVLALNRARATSDLALFEVGRIYGAGDGGGVEERLRAALLLSGQGAMAQNIGAKSCDFFDMKGFVEVYVERFWGLAPRWESGAPAPVSTDRSAAVIADGARVGYLGEPSREARAAFDLPADLPVFVAEIDLDARRAATADVLFRPLPRFPGALRDLAFVVEKGRRHEELVAAVREAAGELLDEVRLFDVYEGPPLAETEMSLAYTLSFRSPERSLTNEEVDAVIARIVERLREGLGARIR